MSREQKEYSQESVAKIIPLQKSDISQALLNSISNCAGRVNEQLREGVENRMKICASTALSNLTIMLWA
jgi:hypothetical protein